MSQNCDLLKNTKLISLVLAPLLLASIFAVPAQALGPPDSPTYVFVAILLGKNCETNLHCKIVASEQTQDAVQFTDPGNGNYSATVHVTAWSENLYNRVNRKYGNEFNVTISSVNTGPGVYTFQEVLPEHGKNHLTIKVCIQSESTEDLSLTVILDPPT